MTIQVPAVAIVILNWNSWKDTLECLESVFRIDYPRYRVIVCDNGSKDGSMDHIREWAEGKLHAEIGDDNPLRGYSHPPVPKPISYVNYERNSAESGGQPSDKEIPLILIQTGDNLGFAGGNNVGLRYALVRGDFDYVWLLNNDTVIEPTALTPLVKRMQKNSNIGICGSTLLYYHEPDKIQARGGATYNTWLAYSRHIGILHGASEAADAEAIERRMDYVVGASMLVSRSFLYDIGLMNEDYFIYCEEIDWATRGRKKRFELAYALDSIVYHKEGVSAGSSYLNKHNKTLSSEYYAIRSRLLFTRKFYPLRLPTVYLNLLARMAIYSWRKRWERVWMIFKLGVWNIKEILWK